jgi:tetratricopeptide (TPR) repeat protein
MKNRHLLFVSILILFFSQAYCQAQTNEKLAAQYLANGETDKAVILLEQIYLKDLSNEQNYRSYVNSLLQIKQFEKAEKVIKKRPKKFYPQAIYHFDLGNLLLKKGENNKAAKEFEKSITEVDNNIAYATQLIANFFEINELDFIKKLIANERLKNNDPSLFYNELSKVNFIQNNKSAIIEEQLDFVQAGLISIQQAQNAFSDYLTEQNELKLLRNVLLKKSQLNPDFGFYNELLAWVYIQLKDYEAGLTQNIALDRIRRDEGVTILNYAAICRENEAFDVAIKAYQYIITQGIDNEYLAIAKLNLLLTQKAKAISLNQTTQTLIALKPLFENYIQLNDGGNNAAIARKAYAELLAYYLQEPNLATSVLEKIIEDQIGKPNFINECKLVLGDVYLMTGEIWESALLYGQVDKANKDEPIGQLAKFKNAQLAYYTSEFEWAKSQLDILKSSTSQLIANDAINLSLIIADNTNLDSTSDALSLYAKADLLIIQQKYKQANLVLDSINLLYPGHELADDVLWTKSQIDLKLNDTTAAIQKLTQLVAMDIEGLWADDALFCLANTYDTLLHDRKKGMEYLQRLIVEMPGSLYAVTARKLFRKWRGDDL